MRKAFISPSKYVQGEDEILNLGYFVKTFGETALLIAHPDDVRRVKTKLDATAEKFGVKFLESDFRGECSRQEITRLQKLAAEKNADLQSDLEAEKPLIQPNVLLKEKR